MAKTSPGNPRPSPEGSPVEVDLVLLQQLEEVSSGQAIHQRANLCAVYRSAMEAYGQTGDEEFRLLAAEAHRELRRLLARLRQAHFTVRANCFFAAA